MRAIAMIFTPMIDKSSDEASLTITATLPVCGVVEVDVPAADEVAEPTDPPPPHADSSTAAMLSDNSRDELDIITLSMSQRVGCNCCGICRGVVDDQPNGRSVGALTT